MKGGGWYRLAEVLSNVAALVLLCCGQSKAAVQLAQNVAVELLEMDTPSDFAVGSLFVFLGYTFQYIASAGLFELTHPYGVNSRTISTKQREARRQQVRKELILGIGAMLANIAITMVWMRYIEPHIWTYAFFQRQEYSLTWLLVSIPVYMFIFDAWCVCVCASAR